MGKNNKKPSSFRKNPRVQFDKRGSFKKGKRPNTNFEMSGEDFNADKTIYRILCPIKKIGSVIGKGGDIIKRLRDETHAKIKVAESVPGSDERVVIVFSSSTKRAKVSDNNENQENPEEDTAKDEHDPMEPHCPAQHALLKVHERIAEDDGLFGGPVREERNEDDLVTARILVPSNQVGCLIGKGGHVIQKLRTESGANIRILPKDHIPVCAMRTDELVQISGTSAVANKALYEVSTLLYQNPRPPMDDPIPDDGQGFYPPPGPMGSMPPLRNPMSQWDSGFRGPPPMPWENEFPRFPPRDASAEFSMKILCPTERIGGVIGKSGGNMKHLQHETGTKIHVEETTPDAAERVILVSSFDAPWNPISPTIEAILHLQVETNAISEDGTITTRLLVPSSKVGCLLGQGGHIINEMRRRSRADIRIISKEGKPSYASVDEELVQVSGNVNVARDALTEISSRLRMRSLESISGAAEPGPVGAFHGFGHPESFPERRGPPPGMTGGRTSGRYQHMKGGGYDFDAPRYPPQPTSRFPNINSSMQVKIPNSAINSVLGVGGSNISNIVQVSGAKVKLNDSQGGGSECVVEIHGSLEQMDVAQNLLQNYISSSTAEHKYNSHPPPQPQATPYANHHPYSSMPNNPSPAAAPNSKPQQYQNSYGSATPAAAPSSNSQQYQHSYGSATAAAAPSSNAQQYQTSYGNAAAPSSNTQQYQSHYGSTTTAAAAAPSSNTQYQQQNSYAAAPTSNTAQQYQTSYGSAAAAPTANNQSPYAAAAPSSNTQQHHYASSGVQNYISQQPQQQQQQQSPYAAAVPTYSAYQQQQQQSAYGSAAQNYSVQQQQPEQQGSYASAAQGYEGQQGSSYQY